MRFGDEIYLARDENKFWDQKNFNLLQIPTRFEVSNE